MATLLSWITFSPALLLSAVPVQNSMFRCQSDYSYGPVAVSAKKGLAVDDTTYRWCSEAIPGNWPNAMEPVTSIRLFRAWDASWQDDRLQAYDNLKKFVASNGAKVLLGVSVTCSAEADALEWGWAKELLQLLGHDHVMGIAIGNEVELLFSKGEKLVPTGCVEGLWDNGGFWNRFTELVSEFDRLGFQDVPITTVFGGLALAGNDARGEEFFEQPGKALVNSFFLNATQRYGTRYAWTWNVYPYFDPFVKLDEGTTDRCEGARHNSLCWDVSCNAPASMAYYRKKMSRLTGRDDDIMWVGETGWNSLGAPNTEMKKCKNWGSMDSLDRYYANFLKWEVTVRGVRPPDHVFYFSIRDSLNFGGEEHFGLIEQCSLNHCKLHSSEFEVPEPVLPIIPGCYYQQPTEGSGACDGPWKFWKFDEYGLTLANSSSESEARCLERKVGHDGFCGTDTRWLFVAPLSPTTTSIATAQDTTTSGAAESTTTAEATTASSGGSSAEPSTSITTPETTTTSMGGSSAKASTSNAPAAASTTSMGGSGAEASTSTTLTKATTASSGGSSAEATTSTTQAEAATTSAGGYITEASTSITQADPATTGMGGPDAGASTSRATAKPTTSIIGSTSAEAWTTPNVTRPEIETDASAMFVPALALQLTTTALPWFALEAR
eukprot:TRINITY_DN14285_c0_g2_i1.p1 TRINITY_DN14285_c0_g2~~TRINITY_DN14285_c0_g2_i1.p1  ORF type:complete len:665 (+),score=107.20 TRINITY_DN14285_c0_g2_i1:47-2041(+)